MNPPGIYRQAIGYWTVQPTYQNLVPNDFGDLVSLTDEQHYALLTFKNDGSANTAAEHAFLDARAAYMEAGYARSVAVRAEEAARAAMLALLPPGVAQ